MSTKFELQSTQTVAQPGQKKYVSYSILIKAPNDAPPVVVERRYTDFLELYRALRRENPELMDGIAFPKKVILGNFSPNLISVRAAGFEVLLKYVSEREKLRDSLGLQKFLVGPEEKEALKLLKMGHYISARPYLVYVFYTLNKIYTDRHHSVLIALCRLAACCNAELCSFDEAEKYGELALRRFETVSDVDLLRFYVPLLQMCSRLWQARGRDTTLLEARLNDMRRQGHRVDDCPTLLDAIMALE